MGRQKAVRLDQILSILSAIGIDSGEFFWELYRPGGFAAVRRGHGEAGPKMAIELEELKSAMGELARTLVRKGLLRERDLPALLRDPTDDEPSNPGDDRQLPLLSDEAKV